MTRMSFHGHGHAFTFMNPRVRDGVVVHGRRSVLKTSLAGLGGLTLPGLMKLRAEGVAKKSNKSVILLWMTGGPSQIDTWDPKPGTPQGGPHKAIKTATPGLSISEHMPELARLSQKLCVVRGLVHKEGNHQRANALLHTSYSPTPTVEHPSLGGWASKRLGPTPRGLPAFVSLGGPSHSAGFFGVQHGPFVLQKPGGLPQNVTHAPQVDDRRFASRLGLLEQLENPGKSSSSCGNDCRIFVTANTYNGNSGGPAGADG